MPLYYENIIKTYNAIKWFPSIGNTTDDILLQLLLSGFRSWDCHYESRGVEIVRNCDKWQWIIGQQGVGMSTLESVQFSTLELYPF